MLIKEQFMSAGGDIPPQQLNQQAIREQRTPFEQQQYSKSPFTVQVGDRGLWPCGRPVRHYSADGFRRWHSDVSDAACHAAPRNRAILGPRRRARGPLDRVRLVSS